MKINTCSRCLIISQASSKPYKQNLWPWACFVEVNWRCTTSWNEPERIENFGMTRMEWFLSTSYHLNYTQIRWLISAALSHLTRSLTHAFSTIAQIMPKKKTLLACYSFALQVLQKLSQCHVISSMAIIIILTHE